MSPLITPVKLCPECEGTAKLNNWSPPEGYDPRMRKYCCQSCGEEFYVIGGDLTAHLAANDPQNDEPDIEK